MYLLRLQYCEHCFASKCYTLNPDNTDKILTKKSTKNEIKNPVC